MKKNLISICTFKEAENLKELLPAIRKYEINADIYCYCSDEKIKDYLPDNVIFVKRSNNLDKNETKGIDIYTSFVEKITSDIYCLCHATSPFLKKYSIINGINNIINGKYDSALSVSKIQTFVWYKNNPLNYELNNIKRTQDISPIYYETSAFYAFKKEIIINKKRRIGENPYFVITNRIESIDIDEKDDYDLAVNIINNSN